MPDLDFVDVVADLLSDMRLLVEGAITLYEDKTALLIRFAADAGETEAHLALGNIGGALYELRRHIAKLQIECYNEAHRQARPDA